MSDTTIPADGEKEPSRQLRGPYKPPQVVGEGKQRHLSRAKWHIQSVADEAWDKARKKAWPIPAIAHFVFNSGSMRNQEYARNHLSKIVSHLFEFHRVVAYYEYELRASKKKLTKKQRENGELPKMVRGKISGLKIADLSNPNEMLIAGKALAQMWLDKQVSDKKYALMSSILRAHGHDSGDAVE